LRLAIGKHTRYPSPLIPFLANSVPSTWAAFIDDSVSDS
jgi:hypothetical protein